MLGTASLSGGMLQAGAYPRRDSEVIGAELALTLREGSRESTVFHGSLGGTSAAFLAEGPFGRSKRGSWILSLRNSYLDWPVIKRAPNDLAFAFADAHAKLVYDISPTQQLTVTALGGRSALEGPDEVLPDALAEGSNRAALATVGWRKTLGSQAVIRQRFSIVTQDFLSRRQTGQHADQERNRALIYRGEVMRTLFGGVLESGGELRSVRGQRQLAPADTLTGMDRAASFEQLPDDFGAAWSTESVYAHFNRTVGRGVSFALGARATGSTLVDRAALARWVLAAWSFKPGWTLSASAGTSQQLPDLEQVRGTFGSPDLKPETATNLDVGIERHLAHVRLQATFFRRAEHDVLREPDVLPRLVDGVMVEPLGPGRYENALKGLSQGIELVAERQGSARLWGSASYSYGRTIQTDTDSRETFWGDFDRRHAFNTVATYRVSDRTSVGVLFRAATNVPIAGYFAVRDGTLVVGARRNDVRLLPYARLDARAQRTFTSSKGSATLFAEVLNIFNRTNLGPAGGFVQSTGEAVGFTRPLLPRRASAGIVIRF